MILYYSLMRGLTFLFLLLWLPLFAQEKLIFGFTPTEENQLLMQKYEPLRLYLEQKIGLSVELQSEYDYPSTIENFAKGRYHFGYIGPVPFLKAQELQNNKLAIVANIQNCEPDYFQSVIVVKKGSGIGSLKELEEKKFAFGSHESTLSYYVPMSMLLEEKMVKKLERYDFLGKHDKVAEFVIMGKYDAGALKHSVAQKYKEYLQVIAASSAYPDFLIVMSKDLPSDLQQKIRKAFLELKEPSVIKSIKSSACGFKEADESLYEPLKEIIRRVDLFESYGR